MHKLMNWFLSTHCPPAPMQPNLHFANQSASSYRCRWYSSFHAESGRRYHPMHTFRWPLDSVNHAVNIYCHCGRRNHFVACARYSRWHQRYVFTENASHRAHALCGHFRSLSQSLCMFYVNREWQSSSRCHIMNASQRINVPTLAKFPIVQFKFNFIRSIFGGGWAYRTAYINTSNNNTDNAFSKILIRDHE